MRASNYYKKYVIPAKAGIHKKDIAKYLACLDSRLRGNDSHCFPNYSMNSRTCDGTLIAPQCSQTSRLTVGNKASNVTFNTTLLLLFSLSFIFFLGCEGAVGPPGHDIPGVDIIPPTIVMTEPWSLAKVYDEIIIKAAAVDNVAISEVIFSIDGSSVFNGDLLFDNIEPFEFTIDAIEDTIRLIDEGWHFIAARAYDSAGNITDAAPIPIYFAYSDDLSGTIALSHHNGYSTKGWTLPDTAGTTSFWTRFNTPKTNTILMSVTALLRGVYTDSTGFNFTVGIWSGTSVPGTIIKQDTLSSDTLSFAVDTLTIDFSGDVAVKVSNDFFVVIEYLGGGENDSLILMSDDGIPSWGRCGTIDDLGKHTLRERFSVGNNFIIECTLDYGGNEDQ
ncbi:hypothetical protein K9N50_11990 [bacterium]|nr:hypothetical protein [bacterium]